jgi:hypothetical protein
VSDQPGTDPFDEASARLDALTREVDALEGDVRAAAERLRAAIGRARSSLEQARSEAADAAAVPTGHAPDADVDGARLTALDLVLRGTPRDQAASELAEKFPGVDAGLLLDEVGEDSAG